MGFHGFVTVLDGGIRCFDFGDLCLRLNRGMGFSVRYERVDFPKAMVLGFYDDLKIGIGALPEVLEAVNRPDFEGKAGEVVQVFPSSGPRVFVLGLGARGGDGFKAAGYGLVLALQKSKIDSVHFQFEESDDSGLVGEEIGLAIGLAGWSAKAFSGSGTEDDGFVDLAVAGIEEGFDKGLRRGLGIAAGMNECRRLQNTPPNIATPFWMADQSMEMASKFGLEARVISGDELKDEWLTGLVTVGKASENKPCLIRLAYVPEGGSDQAPVVLLGKTITYDTGGLSIKSKTGMPGMKYDKSGGCAVFGAMQVIASVIKPSFPVIGLLVAAENCISENAYRPDDVITYRNGVTVEVTNTDAEGRLVLADGLCWAEEVEKAAAILDIATLTGGVVTALGSVYAGGFTRHDDLWNQVSDCGLSCGEMLWRLPLHSDYEKMMVSTVADFVNSVPGGSAHPVQGATFLSQFVTDKTPWIHIDMAGKGKSSGSSFMADGPSGFGVRLMSNWVESWAKS